MARNPVPSRSGREPLGDSEVEEEAGAGDIGTFVSSLARAMRKWVTTKLGCRHLDKTKPATLVNGKNTVHVRTGNGSWAKMATDNQVLLSSGESPYCAIPIRS